MTGAPPAGPLSRTPNCARCYAAFSPPANSRLVSMALLATRRKAAGLSSVGALVPVATSSLTRWRCSRTSSRIKLPEHLLQIYGSVPEVVHLSCGRDRHLCNVARCNHGLSLEPVLSRCQILGNDHLLWRLAIFPLTPAFPTR